MPFSRNDLIATILTKVQLSSLLRIKFPFYLWTRGLAFVTEWDVSRCTFLEQNDAEKKLVPA